MEEDLPYQFVLNMNDINLKIKAVCAKMLKFVFYTSDLDPRDPLLHKKLEDHLRYPPPLNMKDIIKQMKYLGEI
jgi:hypothetical protein